MDGWTALGACCRCACTIYEEDLRGHEPDAKRIGEHLACTDADACREHALQVLLDKSSDTDQIAKQPKRARPSVSYLDDVQEEARARRSKREEMHTIKLFDTSPLPMSMPRPLGIEHAQLTAQARGGVFSAPRRPAAPALTYGADVRKLELYHSIRDNTYYFPGDLVWVAIVEESIDGAAARAAAKAEARANGTPQQPSPTAPTDDATAHPPRPPRLGLCPSVATPFAAPSPTIPMIALCRCAVRVSRRSLNRGSTR